MEIKATSKINIGLHVHNKRSDGFHNISTLFQEIDLCDTIKITEDKKFSCTTDCGTIKEKDNFGTKAFNIMKAQYPDMPNVRISIKKTVPTNAGLGGTITSEFERKDYIKFSDQGTGFQVFKYPDLSLIHI